MDYRSFRVSSLIAHHSLAFDISPHQYHLIRKLTFFFTWTRTWSTLMCTSPDKCVRFFCLSLLLCSKLEILLLLSLRIELFTVHQTTFGAEKKHVIVAGCPYKCTLYRHIYWTISNSRKQYHHHSMYTLNSLTANTHKKYNGNYIRRYNKIAEHHIK